MVGDQSKPNKRTTKKDEKKQKESKKDFYISLLFSIMPYEMMTTYKHSKYTIDGKQYESVWMVKPHKSVWKKGKFNKKKINKALFVDCSDLVINIDKGEVDDPEELMALMDNAMVKIHKEMVFIQGKLRSKKKANVHFILGSDTECQDLVYAANYVCDKTMGDKISDPDFSKFVTNKYASYFDNYTNKGWSVKVDYCGAFEIKIIHAPMMPSNEKADGTQNKQFFDQNGLLNIQKPKENNKKDKTPPKMELLDFDIDEYNNNKATK